MNSNKSVFERLDNQDVKLEEISETLSELLNHNNTNKVSSVTQSYNNIRILEEFIGNASKNYYWLGTRFEFKRARSLSIIMSLLLIIVGIISTVVTSLFCKLYTTFTFIENFGAFACFWILAYTIRARKIYDCKEIASHSTNKFINEEDGLWIDTKVQKKRYRWIRKLCYLSVIMNILYIYVNVDGFLALFTIIIELSFGVFIFLVFYFNDAFLNQYTHIILIGYNSSNTKVVTLVFDPELIQLLSKEDFENKYEAITK